MEREFVCIVCPSSCELTVCERDGKLIVSGNQCDHGFSFAEKEIYDPERILTTTVKLTNGGLLPVRSSALVKKDEICSIVAGLKTLIVSHPVRIGQVVAANVGVNSVDIIATDEVE